MQSNKPRSPPTFPREGIVITKVLKIFLRDFAFETNLRTLPILKDLISVVEAPNPDSVNTERKILISVKITTKKSKMFQGLVKQFLNP